MAKDAWTSRVSAMLFHWRLVYSDKLHLGVVEFPRQSSMTLLAEWFVQLGSSPLGYEVLLPRGDPAAKIAFVGVL